MKLSSSPGQVMLCSCLTKSRGRELEDERRVAYDVVQVRKARKEIERRQNCVEE